MNLYLVKRGPRPSYHNAPYHPVIICTRRPIAEWEAGWTGDKSWVWLKEADTSSGWLLVKWNGLNIDYGHIVRGCSLPDGTETGVFHDRKKEPWNLMAEATWWSDHNMPQWVADKGTKYPTDNFTIYRISEGHQMLSGVDEERLIGSINRNIERCGNWIGNIFEQSHIQP